MFLFLYDSRGFQLIETNIIVSIALGQDTATSDPQFLDDFEVPASVEIFGGVSLTNVFRAFSHVLCFERAGPVFSRQKVHT